MKNFVGLDFHPSDDLVHWSDKDKVKKMEAAREAWDKIKAAGLEKELRYLLDERARVTNEDCARDGAI